MEKMLLSTGLHMMPPLILSLTNKCSCIFSAALPIAIPIDSPIFEKNCPPSNTEPIKNLSRIEYKGDKNDFFRYIPGFTKFEVHLQNFPGFFTREGCCGTIYLGITRETSHIFYGLILLLKGLIYSLVTSFC